MTAAGNEHPVDGGLRGHQGGKIVPLRREAHDIVLTQEEALQFLLRSAGEYEIVFCTIEGCEVCHAFCDLWDSVYSALSPSWRAVVDGKLDAGLLLRPRPVEAGY